MKRVLFYALLSLAPLPGPFSYCHAKPVGGQNPPQKQPGKAETPPQGQAAQAPGASAAASGTSKDTKDENVDRAFAIFREGKDDEAYKQLVEAVKKNPNLPPARVMMYRMYMAVGKVSQARQALEVAAVDSAEHPDVYMTFGDTALKEGRYTDAVLQFEHVLVLMNDPKGKWNDSQKKNVRLAAFSGLSRANQGRGQWEKSKEYLEAALKLDFPKSQLAGFRADLGRVYFMMDKLDDAKRELEQAEKDEPAIDPTGVSMGRLYSARAQRETAPERQKEALKKAKEWFEYAVKKDPKSYKARINYAVWLFDYNYLARPYLEMAREEVEEAAKLDVKQLDIRLLRGLIHRYTANYEAAETEFESVSKEQPNDFNASNQLVLSLLEQSSNPAKQQRARMLAEDNFRRYVGRVPEAYATLGWVLLRAGSTEDAEKLIQQSFQSGQASADVLYYWAKVLQVRGQLDKAAEVLKAAVNSQGRFMYRKEAGILLEQIGGKAPNK